MYGYGYSYPNNPQGSGPMGRYEAGVRSDGGSFAFPIDTGLASRLEGLGLLNASSLVNSCNAGKESVLYNLVPTPVQSLDRFAVTRSTVKWVIGANGLLQEIPANTPAFEYNTDGTYRGLLVEPAGTNTIRNNTQVGAVVGSPGTVPTNWFVVMRGLTQQVVATGTENGVDYIDIRLSGTATSSGDTLISTESTTSTVATTGQAWTGSAWIKKVGTVSEPTAYRLTITEYTAAGAFVLANNSNISPTSSLVRYPYPVTTSGGGTVARVAFGVSFTVVSGNSYDFTIRIGLPQMETGSVATSVIKTSGTSLTRTADSVTLIGASSLIGQAEGTVFVEYEAPIYTSSANRRLLTLSQGTSQILLQLTTSGNLNYTVIDTGASQASIQEGTTSALSRKVALCYKVNDFALYANGVSVGTDTSGTAPTTDAVALGSTAAGAQQIQAWIRSVVLFPSRLANATLASLTA